MAGRLLKMTSHAFKTTKAGSSSLDIREESSNSLPPTDMEEVASADAHAHAQETRVEDTPSKIYSALKTAGEIRLVTINTNLQDGRVSCQVSPASLSAEYVAISYAWGDNTLASTILLNGRPFRVTANCEQLLRALRQQMIKSSEESRPRIPGYPEIPGELDRTELNLNGVGLWIDALCIDQHNIGERNAQVAQMDEIYCKARRTVVYLGDHDEHSAMVLSIDDRPDTQCRHPKKLFKRGFKRACGKCSRLWVAYFDSHATHIECFSNRPWFQRMWVVQEVLLAKECMFLVSCTSNTLFASYSNWYTFGELSNVWSLARFADSPIKVHEDHKMRLFEDSVYDRSSKDVPALPAILGMLQDFDGCGGEQYRPKGRLELALWRLNALMDVTRGSGCSDPRDKIFAIMSLFPKPLPKLLQPDYGKTVCETYTDAMWFLVDYGHTENLLAAGRTDLHSATFPELPSWVLDFSSATVTKSHWQAGFPTGQKRVVAIRHGHTLTIRGVRVAMVQTVPLKTLSDDNRRDYRYEIRLDDKQSAYVPPGTEVGDYVCVFLGVEMPMLLRSLGDSSWQLVGQCFVAGLMSGEVVEGIDWDAIDDPIPQAPLEDFHIR